MKRLFAAAVAMMVVTGCTDPADFFRNGLPRQEMVEIQTPAETSQKITGRTITELKGDRSGSYQLTRGATVAVNGGTLFVLALLKAITDHPPTTIEENQAVWGPYDGDALDPITWKLVANKTSETSVSYSFMGKAKGAGDDAYVVVLSGMHVQTAEDYGNGTFLLDFDAAQTLPEHGADVGTAEITYAREQGTNKVNVSAEFLNVNNGAGGRENFSYRYEKLPGSGGSFDFMIRGDAHNGEPGLTLEEKFTVHSRWLETGAGRADYEVSGGDLTAAATGNECWDTSFNSQYLQISFDPSQDYGVEADDCAIIGAVYSEL